MTGCFTNGIKKSQRMRERCSEESTAGGWNKGMEWQKSHCILFYAKQRLSSAPSFFLSHPSLHIKGPPILDQLQLSHWTLPHLLWIELVNKERSGQFGRLQPWGWKLPCLQTFLPWVSQFIPRATLLQTLSPGVGLQPVEHYKSPQWEGLGNIVPKVLLEY